jgi:hypothetical protein
MNERMDERKRTNECMIINETNERTNEPTHKQIVAWVEGG